MSSVGCRLLFMLPPLLLVGACLVLLLVVVLLRPGGVWVRRGPLLLEEGGGGEAEARVCWPLLLGTGSWDLMRRSRLWATVWSVLRRAGGTSVCGGDGWGDGGVDADELHSLFNSKFTES